MANELNLDEMDESSIVNSDPVLKSDNGMEDYDLSLIHI